MALSAKMLDHSPMESHKPFLHLSGQIHVPLTEISFSFARSSGTGGQNVNKVNSKAILRWHVVSNRSLPWEVRERFGKKYQARISDAGDLILQSERYRDQGRNVADCLEKLRVMLVSVLQTPKKRKATRPNRSARENRLKLKKQRSEKKESRKSRRYETD